MPQNARSNWNRRAFLAAGIAATVLAAAGPLGAEQQAPLRIALATSVSNKAAEVAARQAEAEGLTVELLEFNDWNTPNMAVAEKEADANLFQHMPFLEFTNRAKGYDLVAIAPAFSTPFGLYSKKYKGLADLPDDARIAFSGDAVNTARSLLLLQAAGLVELKPGADHRATLEDVAKWVKPVQVVQLDGPQIARALDDVDAAATYPTFAKLAGLDASSGLIFENDAIYAFQFVTRPDMRDDPRLKRFIEIYRTSPEVKKTLTDLYGAMVSFP